MEVIYNPSKILSFAANGTTKFSTETDSIENEKSYSISMNQVEEEDGESVLTIILNGLKIFEEINDNPYYMDQANVTFTQPPTNDVWTIKHVSIINGKNSKFNVTGKSTIRLVLFHCNENWHRGPL